jgi:hypothetical protein
MNMASYIQNQIPNNRSRDKTPFEMLFGVKPDVKHMRIFGSETYAQIPEEKRINFDAKCYKCYTVGYNCDLGKVLRVFDREKRRSNVVSDAKIEEMNKSTNNNKLKDESQVVDENVRQIFGLDLEHNIVVNDDAVGNDFDDGYFLDDIQLDF